MTADPRRHLNDHGLRQDITQTARCLLTELPLELRCQILHYVAADYIDYHDYELLKALSAHEKHWNTSASCIERQVEANIYNEKHNVTSKVWEKYSIDKEYRERFALPALAATSPELYREVHESFNSPEFIRVTISNPTKDLCLRQLLPLIGQRIRTLPDSLFGRKIALQWSQSQEKITNQSVLCGACFADGRTIFRDSCQQPHSALEKPVEAGEVIQGVVELLWLECCTFGSFAVPMSFIRAQADDNR